MKKRSWLAEVPAGTLKQVCAIWTTGYAFGLIFYSLSPVRIHGADPIPSLPPEAQFPAALRSVNASFGISPGQSSSEVNSTSNSSTPNALLSKVATNHAARFVPPFPATWAEIKPLMEHDLVLLVDARPSVLYKAGHIPKSVNLPEPPSGAEWKAFCQRYPPHTPLIVYCGNTSCSVSYKLATRLASEGGYEFVRYMTGGYLDWLREETLLHSNQSLVGTRSNLLLPPGYEMPAQALGPILDRLATNPVVQKWENAFPIAWAQAHLLLNFHQAVFLDARSKQEYDNGHIDGAISLPADSTVEVIRKALAKHNSSTRLITYCGAMGCPEAFLLATRLMRELDFSNAQFMLEGYAEWRHLQSNSPNREVNSR